MTALTVTAVSLRRLLRDRTAMFFVVLLPVVVILVIGATVGGHSNPRVVVVDQDHSPISANLVAELRSSSGIVITVATSEDQARTAVRRGEQTAAVVIPAGFGSRLGAGGTGQVAVIGSAAPGSRQAADAVVGAIVARNAAPLQAAAFAAQQGGGDFTTDLALARRLQATTQAVTVQTHVVNSTSDVLPGGFGYSAPTMLVLFVFVNALAGGAAMIQARGLGIYDRALAAPVRPADVVLGEALGLLSLTLLQSLLIIAVGLVVFGVTWGNPLAAAVLVFVWALVGTGAGMLSGTLFRTPEQASAIGPSLGIALGMLGGCMWPLAIVAPFMRSLGHAAPQAWAVDAWTTLLSKGGQLADIATQLAVLSGFGLGLLALAAYLMRRTLVT